MAMNAPSANSREVERRRAAEDLAAAAIALLLDDLYTPAEREQWLDSRHPMLGHAVPRALIRQGRGAEVLRVIRCLREGGYV